MSVDRISQLADPLICQILCHIPIEDAVKTSVLSTRWKTLWLWIPRLELNSENLIDFNDFVSLCDRIFDSDRVSCIDTLKLTLDGDAKGVDDASCLNSWIDAAVKRKVQHLHVLCPPDCFRFEIPISLYSCQTLVYLKLFEVVLDDDAQFVSLPCLKTMHLEYLWYVNEATFERLVSSCPVLEELKIFGCENIPKDLFKVHSLSLKKLEIIFLEDLGKYQVVIDAPLLGCLKIQDNGFQSYILVNNLDSNAKLDISLFLGLYTFDDESVLSRRNSILDFLPRISKVGEVIIHLNTFKVFLLCSILEPLPRFDCMSSLDASVHPSDLEWLPTFLECCPNLKSLVLALDACLEKINSEEMNQISFSSVPECLLSSLESVYIESNLSGYFPELKVVRYFLENSAILKKLTLQFQDYYCAQKMEMLQAIPRRSATCEVVLL